MINDGEDEMDARVQIGQCQSYSRCGFRECVFENGLEVVYSIFNT